MSNSQIKEAKKYIVVSKAGNSPEAIQLIQTLVQLEPRLISFHGKDCGDLEAICDIECVGDGTGSVKEITTTSHPNEPLADVINMVELWDIQEIGEKFELIEIN